MNALSTSPGPHAARLAPTPSGFLHAGNAIAFLLTCELASRTNATLRLRIDDLDAERVRPAYVQDIFDSLHWLGIGWDLGPTDSADHNARYSQGLRLHRYHELVDRLWTAGELYACTCTRAQLEQLRAEGLRSCACREMDLPPETPGATLRLRLPMGRQVRIPAWKGLDEMVDLAMVMDDPVLRQRSVGNVPGRAAYQIASLADDLDHGSTLIVRGLDLLPSTACQCYIAELLGLDRFLEVHFVHHELVVGADGHKLSKSGGSSSIQAMRAAGEGPETLHAQAAALIARVL